MDAATKLARAQGAHLSCILAMQTIDLCEDYQAWLKLDRLLFEEVQLRREVEIAQFEVDTSEAGHDGPSAHA